MVIKENMMQLCFTLYVPNMGTVKEGCMCVLIWCHSDPVLTPLFLACFQIFEAYGQTECTAACSFTIPGDCNTGGFLWLIFFFFFHQTSLSTDFDFIRLISGHVGVPIPCNIVKLVDVEEMNYFTSNGEGEVMEHHFINHKPICN